MSFYVDLDGKKMCEEGEIEKLDEGWLYESTVYDDFNDCYAEQDMQLAFHYLIILVIICLKFFFFRVMCHWFKSYNDENSNGTIAQSEQDKRRNSIGKDNGQN